MKVISLPNRTIKMNCDKKLIIDNNMYCYKTMLSQMKITTEEKEKLYDFANNQYKNVLKSFFQENEINGSTIILNLGSQFR